MADLRLLEDWEYLYEIQLTATVNQIRTDRPDILLPDSTSGDRGRLKPGSRVGTMPVGVWADGEKVGTALVEVRSRKLGYESSYRWMLRDIAEISSTLIMERFAPAERHFKPNQELPPNTAYERFAFLNNLLRDELFQAAMAEIVRRPHHGWLTEEATATPARGLHGDSASVRALLAPGPRVGWPRSFIKGLETLPRALDIRISSETLDTPPNRFVKFALLNWLGILQSLGDAIARSPDRVTRTRATQEVASALSRLQAWLDEPLFLEVGDLQRFPAGDTALMGREGYRDILNAYVLSECASQLAWQGGQDVYSAGQRDVATLYEYWCFFQLIRMVRGQCDNFDERSILQEVDGDLGVALQKGSETVLTGTTRRLGRLVNIALHYNKTFAVNPTGSWTRTMRPDYSIRLSSDSSLPAGAEDVWMHFDAKYRVDRIQDVLGTDFEDPNMLTSAAKRDDLLKMHAYRDAIRRSAGSYVLYPGSSDDPRPNESLRQYQEILPGLGAFSLRPTETAGVAGEAALSVFLTGAVSHFASVLSQDRRARYWSARSFDKSEDVTFESGWSPVDNRPPADTAVLLGWVKSHRHLEWIRATGRYNLRLGDRAGAVGLAGPEVSAAVLILYGSAEVVEKPELWRIVGSPELWTESEMDESRYPNPRGSYLCLPVQPDEAPAAGSLSAHRISSLGKPNRAPTITTWLDVVR